VQKGHVSQTDESAFEVGRNVATTEGTVVFENELFQLIEYKPLTAKVHERPDAVRAAVHQQVLHPGPAARELGDPLHRRAGPPHLRVSWRNPDESMAAKTWDDYIENGPIAAIRTVQAITGADTINMLGFCVGGTISPPRWPCWPRAASSRPSR
jgi:polyhydroxyalkanoate synthase